MKITQEGGCQAFESINLNRTQFSKDKIEQEFQERKIKIFEKLQETKNHKSVIKNLKI